MVDSKRLTIEVPIQFRGGEAEDHRLDFYDGAESLFGFARALLLLSSNYLVHGKVAFQAPSVRGVRAFMLPAKPGSFAQIIQLVLENPGATAFGAVSGVVLWDFTKLMFARTVGTIAKPKTSFVNSVESAKISDLDSLSEAITNPLRTMTTATWPGSPGFWTA
jgi:hypothetical protein